MWLLSILSLTTGGTVLNFLVPTLGTLWDIITDGDDTLWLCGPYYDAVARVCFRLVQMQFPGADEHALRNRCRRIQASLIRRHGYYNELFEDAWVETYLGHCHTHRQAVCTMLTGAIYRAATSVHDGSYPVYPGVVETLAQLQQQGHRIHLLTLGDDHWQREKVTRNGLDRFFTSIHVVRRSKGPHMRLIANGGERAIMVGDSLVREVQPAVRLGLTAVWVHSEDPWANHGHSLDHRSYYRIDHFQELPDLLTRLELPVA